tara:strand:+ start:12744 stop:14753 length:2010 start_codon:yes stop_codon:yes gene_type:complete
MADWVTDLLENLGYNLPSEQDAREDASLSSDQIARETYPEFDLQDTPTDLTTLGGNAILKEIVFENSSKESAFQKYINWLISNGVASISREGQPLGESITLGGTQMMDARGNPLSQLMDLRSTEAQNRVFDFFKDNWMHNKELVESLRQQLQTGITEMSNRSYAGEDYNWESDAKDPLAVDPELAANIIRVFSDVGSDEANIANLNTVLGNNALQWLISQRFAPVLRQEINKLAANNRSVLFGPNLAAVGEQITDGDALQPEMAWITSFDGTPYGDVQSLKDLFSGGLIGPQDAWFYMQDLYEKTRNGAGYSPIVERIQQELYAYGYMNVPDEWGKLDIINMENKADTTIDALQMLQTDQVNEGLRIANDPNVELSPDGSAYVRSVMDRAMARKLDALPARKASVAGQQAGLIENVVGTLEQLATLNGSTFNDAGKASVRNQLKEMIGSADEEMLEGAFGGGGDPQKLQLADLVLRNFYQDDNWANNIYLGANDSDIDYFRYAKRSGALSNEELITLQTQLDDTGTYIEEFGQPMYGTNFDDTGTAVQPRDTNAVAKDIVSSYMLDLLETPEGQQMDITQALTTFGHTAGARISQDFEYTAFDYEQMAEDIYSQSVLAPDPEQSELQKDLTDRLTMANDLVGRGPALRALTDAMQDRRGFTSFSPMRNR